MRLLLCAVGSLVLALVCWVALAVQCRPVAGVVTRRRAEMRTYSLFGVRYVDARYLLTVRTASGELIEADVPVRQYGLTHPGDRTRVMVRQGRAK